MIDRCGIRCITRVLPLCATIYMLGCSENPSASRDGSGGRMSSTAGRASMSTDKEAGGMSAVSYTCEASPTQACYCANGGALKGTQTCTPRKGGGATVGPCSGCPTEAPVKTSAEGLCPDLRSQAGCKATTFRSEELPASVLFLVDRSGSMLCNTPPLQASADCGIEPVDASMPSKWNITVDSLGKTFDDLVGSNVNLALSFFSLDGECATGVPPAVPLSELNAAHAKTLRDELGMQTAVGRTPIVSGLINAYQYMHWEALAGCAVEPCGAPGNRFVVLLTDGAESCASSDEQQRLLTETVTDALKANIRTFVIGAPGSEPARGFLSQLAFQGGTARSDDCIHAAAGIGETGDCHFDMTNSSDFAADLLSGLGDIGGSVGCSFGVTGKGSVNVQYTLSGDSAPQCLGRSEAMPCDAGAEGWQFAKTSDGSDDTSQVVICGAACAAIQNDAAAQVDIVLGCTTLDGPE